MATEHDADEKLAPLMLSQMMSHPLLKFDQGPMRIHATDDESITIPINFGKVESTIRQIRELRDCDLAFKGYNTGYNENYQFTPLFGTPGESIYSQQEFQFYYYPADKNNCRRFIWKAMDKPIKPNNSKSKQVDVYDDDQRDGKECWSTPIFVLPEYQEIFTVLHERFCAAVRAMTWCGKCDENQKACVGCEKLLDTHNGKSLFEEGRNSDGKGTKKRTKLSSGSLTSAVAQLKRMFDPKRTKLFTFFDGSEKQISNCLYVNDITRTFSKFVPTLSIGATTMPLKTYLSAPENIVVVSAVVPKLTETKKYLSWSGVLPLRNMYVTHKATFPDRVVCFKLCVWSMALLKIAKTGGNREPRHAVQEVEIDDESGGSDTEQKSSALDRPKKAKLATAEQLPALPAMMEMNLDCSSNDVEECDCCEEIDEN